MSQIYLNGPSVGRAISAEEFAARAGQGPDGTAPASAAGCGASGCAGPDGCQQLVCCCHTVPTPPTPPQVDELCCCKQSFRAALGLLCGQELSGLLDFDAVAFVTDTYTAGAAVERGKSGGGRAAGGTPGKPGGDGDEDGSDGNEGGGNPGGGNPGGGNPGGGPSDNLGDLEGSFRRFAPCSCDLLDIDAQVYTAAGKGCTFTASQASLCALDAVAIQAAEGESKGDRNFRCVRSILSRSLNPCGDGCGQDSCSCDCDCDREDCCCAAGLLSTLARGNLSRRVSLVAGLLVLQNVTLLGTVGSVLVLANDCDERIYFVCVNSVQFVA